MVSSSSSVETQSTRELRKAQLISFLYLPAKTKTQADKKHTNKRILVDDGGFVANEMDTSSLQAVGKLKLYLKDEMIKGNPRDVFL